MNRKYLEEQVTPELKWKKIEDIPNFPLNSFEDVKRHVEANQFSVGIHVGSEFEHRDKLVLRLLYSASQDIHYNFFFFLSKTPEIIIIILPLVLAFALGNYWLIVGTVLGILPGVHYNDPSKEYFLRRSLKYMLVFLFFVFVYGLWQGKETITYLSAFFIFSFFIDNLSHSMKQNKLKNSAMQSEKIFIFLYQAGKLGLKDNSNEQMYWHIEN